MMLSLHDGLLLALVLAVWSGVGCAAYALWRWHRDERYAGSATDPSLTASADAAVRPPRLRSRRRSGEPLTPTLVQFPPDPWFDTLEEERR